MAKGGKKRADRWREVRRLVETGRLDAAEALLSPRLQRGDDATALQWMGVIHFKRQRHASALDAFGAAFALSPSAELRTLSAQTLLSMGSTPIADREARAALRMDPEQADAWAVRARAAQNEGRSDDALAHWRQAQAADPERTAVWGPLALALARACAWDEVDRLRIALTRELEEAVAARRRPALTPTVALYVGMTPPKVRAVAEQWAATEPGAPPRGLTPVKRVNPRVAFMSPRLDAHPNGLLLQSVLRALGERFELFAIDWDSGDDEVHARIQARVQRHLDLRGRSGPSALEAVRELDLDLLVDLGGFTMGQRLELLAQRPARRVAHWLGTPCSMGGFIDARLSCFDWNPTHQDEFFAEPLLRWEGPLVAVDELPVVPEARPPRPEGSGPLFCNLADGYRIGRRSFARWMSVLQDQPQARLWLAEGTEERRSNLRAAAEAAGVAPERLHFEHGGALSSDYPFRSADAWLDGAEIGAGTSGILCAWAGVPLVSTPGETPWSRTGAAVVTAAGGRPAENDEAYLAQARRPPPPPRRTAPLFDVAGFGRRFSDVLVEATKSGVT